MRQFWPILTAILFVLVVVGGAGAGEKAPEIAPGVQVELDKQKTVIAKWAASPEVVRAVKDQNTKGPIKGMDNAKWKTLRSGELVVRGFQHNPAANFLKAKMKEGGTLYTETFLSASQGEKVAFAEKTTSYIHKGSAKFDVPFQTGKPWQGQIEVDESSRMSNIQISVPVVDGGKSIGVLVVGVSVNNLERLTKR